MEFIYECYVLCNLLSNVISHFLLQAAGDFIGAHIEGMFRTMMAENQATFDSYFAMKQHRGSKVGLQFSIVL